MDPEPWIGVDDVLETSKGRPPKVAWPGVVSPELGPFHGTRLGLLR
jgi:hypothetical protein